MKRKKRKQLKEDELITTVGKIIRFVKKRARELVALGVAVALFIRQIFPFGLFIPGWLLGGERRF